MKKVVAILSALVCFMLNNLVSQAENKFLTNDKIWHVDIGSPCPDGDNTGCFCSLGYVTYKTGNVISINGRQYTEIIANNIYNFDEWSIQTYLREENNRIYFYSEKCGQEFLMYDFNLKTGDQVNLVDCLFPNCDMDKQDEAYSYTVADVDSVCYNKKQYKRIILGRGNTLNWIEGIGDIMGVIYHPGGWSGACIQLKDCYEADKQVFFNDKPQYCFKNPDDSQANPKSFEISDTLFYGMDTKKIARDSKDTSWIVSDGLYKSYGDSVWKCSTDNSNQLSENIRDIAIDSGDTIWMITDKGLMKYDHKNFSAIGDQSIHYNNLAIDKDDYIWLSKADGIVKYDKKSFLFYTKENSKLPSYVHSMMTDSKKNIWIATCDKVNEGSIVRINGDDWTVFDKVNTGIPMYYFTNKSLVADKKGNIYAKIDYSLSSSFNTDKPNILKYDGIRWSVIDSVSNAMDLVEIIGCGGDNIIWKKNISGTKLSYYDGAWHNWSGFDHNIEDITAGTGSDTWFCTNNGVYVIKSESFETVFNQISGVWYKVFYYNGLTGKKDTIYSNEVNEIKRITGTDSIAWTISENDIVKSVSKFRLTYVDSYLFGDKRWMLTSDGLKLLFEADSLFMTCGIDANDAGALGYSRKKLVSGFSVPDNDEFRYYIDPLGLILNISGLPDIEYVGFFDVNGRLLHKATPLPNGSFDIRSLEKGLHIFQVVSKNMVYPGKIIKN